MSVEHKESKSEAAFKASKRERPQRAEVERDSTPRLAGIMIAPLKSGAMQFVDRAYVCKEGLKPSEDSPFGDRSFMFIDENSKDGALLTQRQKSLIALFELKFDAHDPTKATLTFRYDQADQKIKEELGKRIARKLLQSFTFQVKMEPDSLHPERFTKVHTTPGILGIDQGDPVADWASVIIGKNVRLVLQKPEAPRIRTDKPIEVPGLEKTLVQLRFADSFPFTLISEAGLDGFAKAMEQEAASLHEALPEILPQAWRMNFLLSGNINEHQVVGKFLKIGEVYFYVKRLKERCPMPANNQDTGVWNGDLTFRSQFQQVLRDKAELIGIPEDFRTRKEEREGQMVDVPVAYFGVDLIPVNNGYLNWNDAVEVLDELPAELLSTF